MMSDKMALKIAIDLMHVPSQVRLVRSEALPDGVLILLRIAAGDAEAERIGALAVDRSAAVLRQAATFFVEQILFAPNADSYRVLGAAPQATAAELRRNVGLLLRWLHPDLDPQGARSIFARRVTAAWNDLKTPARRAAYDETRRRARDGEGTSATGRNVSSRRRSKIRPFAGVGGGGHAASRRNKGGFWRRALSLLFTAPPQ
jgi:hypothetical protein